jgi:hypothetical protein
LSSIAVVVIVAVGIHYDRWLPSRNLAVIVSDLLSVRRNTYRVMSITHLGFDIISFLDILVGVGVGAVAVDWRLDCGLGQKNLSPLLSS